MEIKKIYYTPTFLKNWRRLPKEIKEKAVRKERIFRSNAFYPSLVTHKLKGKFENYWSFSVDYHFRIIFRFLEQGEVLFVDTGTHSIYG